MILCLCRGVPENVVCAAIRAGAGTLNDVEAMCGAGSDCGACQTMIEELLIGDERVAREGTPVLTK